MSVPMDTKEGTNIIQMEQTNAMERVHDMTDGEYTCEERGCTLKPAGEIGGDVCKKCNIFYAPYGWRKWEVR